MVDRVRRAVAIEKDHLEDFVAEARARAESMGEEQTPRGARSAPSEAAE